MQRIVNNKRLRRLLVGLTILGVLALALAACGEDSPAPQRNEAQLRQSSYGYLASHQPAHTMKYSPTRDTINFWIDTWNKPNKLAYVYLQANNGQLIGYYVFKGLPVSYCAALTPNYEFVGTPDDGSDAKDQRVPAPSVDGVYYSGGQCNQYYGRDATTNSYLEFTLGSAMSALVYERPLPRQDVQPLGFTVIPNK